MRIVHMANVMAPASHCLSTAIDVCLVLLLQLLLLQLLVVATEVPVG